METLLIMMRFSVLMLSSFNKVPSCLINPSLVDLNVSRGHISSLTSVFYVSVQTISESCISSDTHHFKNFTSSFLSFSVCWTCFECTYASSVDACRHGAQNYSSRHQHTTRHHETHRGASGVLAVSGAGKKTHRLIVSENIMLILPLSADCDACGAVVRHWRQKIH